MNYFNYFWDLYLVFWPNFQNIMTCHSILLRKYGLPGADQNLNCRVGGVQFCTPKFEHLV